MPTATPKSQWRPLVTSPLAWMAMYFAAHVALRSTAPGILDIDEAEQVVHSQWLAAGYGSQPPLYTWLQMAYFEVLGRNVFALSMLKNTLLFLTYAFSFAAGMTLMGDRTRAGLGMLGLLLLPQVAWASQRDLTHSVLAMCMSAAILWVFVLLLARQRWWMYILLGVVIGLGILSKYNVLFLAVAVVLTGLCSRQGRAAILRPSMLVTLVVAALIVWPHALWIIGNTHALRSAAEDANLTESSSMLMSLGSLAVAVLSAVGPACAVFLLIFAPAWQSRVERNPVRFSSLAFAVLACGMAIALALLTDIPHVKARWLQPVIVIAPVLIAAQLDPGRLSVVRVFLFRGICTITALVVLTLMGVRTLGPQVNNQFDRYTYPFDELAAEIRTRLGREPAVIASDFAFVAGNLKVRFPDSATYIAGMRNAELVANVHRDGGVFVWKRMPRGRVPPELAELLQIIEPDRIRPPRVFEITPRDEPVDSARTLAMIVLRPQRAPLKPISSR